PHTTMDTPTYLAPAHALLHGSYSTPLPALDSTYLRIPPSAVGAPERQTMRAPGYPLLLAAVGGGKPGPSRDVLYVVQALLCGAATLLLTLLARRLWNERLALLAGALAVLATRRRREAAAFAAATALLLGPWLGWTAAAAGKPVLASFGEGWNLLLAAHVEGPRTTAEVEYSKDYSREFNSE